MTRKRRRDPNVTSFVDRHGKERWRWRKAGHQTHYFTAPPGTKEYADELAVCKRGAPLSIGAERTLPKSIGDLVTRYYSTLDFNTGSESDRHRRRLILEAFRAEYDRDMVEHFTFAHIEGLLLKKAQKKQVGARTVGGIGAARNLRKQLRRLFAHAKRLGWIKENPVEDASRIAAPKSKGFHTWTEDEIAQYQAKHPLGTMARLALEIMLWTGQRRSDAHAFGPEHMKNKRIKFVVSKTQRPHWLPAAPQLVEAIDAMPRVGIKTYLTTEYGKPFSRAGFGNKMRQWCDEADLPHCSAHGLRKAIARRMAEMGIGNQGIKAVGGWLGDSEVATYTAAADQRRIAEDVIGQLSDLYLANQSAELANSILQTSDYEGLSYGDGGPGGTVTSDKNQQLELANPAKRRGRNAPRQKPVG